MVDDASSPGWSDIRDCGVHPLPRPAWGGSFERAQWHRMRVGNTYERRHYRRSLPITYFTRPPPASSGLIRPLSSLTPKLFLSLSLDPLLLLPPTRMAPPTRSGRTGGRVGRGRGHRGEFVIVRKITARADRPPWIRGCRSLDSTAASTMEMYQQCVLCRCRDAGFRVSCSCKLYIEGGREGETNCMFLRFYVPWLQYSFPRKQISRVRR